MSSGKSLAFQDTPTSLYHYVVGTNVVVLTDACTKRIAERTNMPSHKDIPVSKFSSKAWSAMCELLGGEERISDDMRAWGDGFIVNLGKQEYDENGEMGVKEMRELDGW